MAQTVGYFEDNVTFTEGPFVIVNPLGNGWRIEVDHGGKCPVLPDLSIYGYVERVFGLTGKTNDKERITAICDHLNSLVSNGRIVWRDGWRFER